MRYLLSFILLTKKNVFIAKWHQFSIIQMWATAYGFNLFLRLCNLYRLDNQFKIILRKPSLINLNLNALQFISFYMFCHKVSCKKTYTSCIKSTFYHKRNYLSEKLKVQGPQHHVKFLLVYIKFSHQKFGYSLFWSSFASCLFDKNWTMMAIYF